MEGLSKFVRSIATSKAVISTEDQRRVDSWLESPEAQPGLLTYNAFCLPFEAIQTIHTEPEKRPLEMHQLSPRGASYLIYKVHENYQTRTIKLWNTNMIYIITYHSKTTRIILRVIASPVWNCSVWCRAHHILHLSYYPREVPQKAAHIKSPQLRKSDWPKTTLSYVSQPNTCQRSTRCICDGRPQKVINQEQEPTSPLRFCKESCFQNTHLRRSYN